MNISSQFSLCSQSIPCNPQQIQYVESVVSCTIQQEIKCRICYESTKPLISICACIGTIGFVHQQCILDWISKKLETADILQMPSCEICHEKFSARMKIGRKKLCIGLLYEKVKKTRMKDLLAFGIHFLIFLFCILTILFSVNALYHDTFKIIKNQPHNQSSISPNTPNNNNFLFNLLQFLFTNIICQIYGIFYFINFLKSKEAWLEDSMVQIVQVVLHPKIIRKC